MGGQLIKGYSIEGDSLASVGLAKSWKLYKGKKEGSHLPASIFLIEKRQLKKSEKEECIKLAKKEAGNLLRVRHPGVLAVVESLTEDDNILAFVTERIEGNMSQLIKHNKLADFMASELQLKLYLYPFLETVAFIHDTLKQAHLGISLQSIYLTADGKWKLAGFGSNLLLTGEDMHQTDQKIYDYSYAAPQLAINKNYCKKSDLFSIGVVVLQLLTYFQKQYKHLQINSSNQYQKYSQQIKKWGKHPIISKSSNPTDLQLFITAILEWDSSKRITISDALSSRWMNDSTLMTVKYLDKINSYQNKQQLQFLKGLAGVLDDFQIRVVTRIILPKLMDLLKFSHLIASIVYIVIDLLKKSKITAELFRKLIWPSLKNVTQGKEMTAQAIYLFVLNQQVLQKFVGEPDTTTHLLPLYIKCFDCPQKLKRLALVNLQRMSKKLDYQAFKTKIIPKLINILKDPIIEVRKDALKGLYTIVKTIDVQTISMAILPALEAARKAGSDSFVNSIINTIYNSLASSLPTDVISSKILPVLIPYLSDPSINKNEFYQFKNTIVSMINKIEKDREKQFDNNANLGNDETVFTEADFKFGDQESKPQISESKGNYNFLNTYLEAKVEIGTAPTQSNTSIVSPGQNVTNPVAATESVKAIKVEQNSQHMGYSFSNVQMDAKLSQPSNGITAQPNAYQFNFDSLSNPGNYQPLSFDFGQINQTGSTFETNIFATEQTKPQIKPNKIAKPIIKSDTTEPAKTELKQIKKQEKPRFVGGASGPMEIKKLVGPNSPVKVKPIQVKKQPQNSGSFDFSYMSNPVPNKKEDSVLNFGMDNLGIGDFGFNYNPTPTQPTIKPIYKPSDQTPISQPSFNFNDGLCLSGSQNNPFAELQSTPPVSIVVPSIKISPGMNISLNINSEPKGKTGNDIYSYFQEQQESKPKNNPFDLI